MKRRERKVTGREGRSERGEEVRSEVKMRRGELEGAGEKGERERESERGR